ncbi:MAG: hypothetical protein HQK67_05860, partial [Desulfamplus sp.]|nr:hypothetical protein [Desulfamplus sp.]
KNEVNFLKNLSSSLEDCTVMLLGDALIISAWRDFHIHEGATLRNRIFLPDPLDPAIIILKSMDILAGIEGNTVTSKSLPNVDNSNSSNVETSKISNIDVLVLAKPEDTLESATADNLALAKSDTFDGHFNIVDDSLDKGSFNDDAFDIDLLEIDLKQYLKLE